jgi:hypothetical protein
MSEANSSRKRGLAARPAVRLGASLEKALVAYAGAATAASVGFLVLAPGAEAKVIYKKVNKPILLNTILPLDLNHDGVTDFTLVDSHATYSFAAFGYLTVFPNKIQNKIMGPVRSATGFYWAASALSTGVQIGSQGPFAPGAKLMVGVVYAGARRKTPRNPSSCFGLWPNVTNRFLGLKFRISGKVHYGWASLDVTCANIQVTGTLTGYAYETKPNQPILSGQTQEGQAASRAGGSLGHLARGAQRPKTNSR